MEHIRNQKELYKEQDFFPFTTIINNETNQAQIQCDKIETIQQKIKKDLTIFTNNSNTFDYTDAISCLMSDIPNVFIKRLSSSSPNKEFEQGGNSSSFSYFTLENREPKTQQLEKNSTINSYILQISNNIPSTVINTDQFSSAKFQTESNYALQIVNNAKKSKSKQSVFINHELLKQKMYEKRELIRMEKIKQEKEKTKQQTNINNRKTERKSHTINQVSSLAESNNVNKNIEDNISIDTEINSLKGSKNINETAINTEEKEIKDMALDLDMDLDMDLDLEDMNINIDTSFNFNIPTGSSLNLPISTPSLNIPPNNIENEPIPPPPTLNPSQIQYPQVNPILQPSLPASLPSLPNLPNLPKPPSTSITNNTLLPPPPVGNGILLPAPPVASGTTLLPPPPVSNSVVLLPSPQTENTDSEDIQESNSTVSTPMNYVFDLKAALLEKKKKLSKVTQINQNHIIEKTGLELSMEQMTLKARRGRMLGDLMDDNDDDDDF